MMMVEDLLASALEGDVAAAETLGSRAYESGDVLGAQRWFGFLAARGEPVGFFQLGVMYELAREFGFALYWFQGCVDFSVAGANQRMGFPAVDVLAATALGRMAMCYLEQGDETSAVELWRAASENGDDGSTHNLAVWHLNQGDREEALRLFRIAAGHGYQGSVDALATLGA